MNKAIRSYSESTDFLHSSADAREHTINLQSLLFASLWQPHFGLNKKGTNRSVISSSKIQQRESKF